MSTSLLATELPAAAAAIVAKRLPGFRAKVGIILGSGLGGLAKSIENAVSIPYNELPGFSDCTISGHKGVLHLGTIHNTPVACLQGRAHYYEGIDNTAAQHLVRTLKLIGCDTLLLTNASGSLRPEVGPGSVVLINDHINFQGTSPLVGKNAEEFGPRFVAMEDAYDIKLRDKIKHIAKKLDIALSEGVYLAVLGPQFETPAEIRAFRLLGADLVGMSTVSEVIVARHCGLRVAALSAVSNYAAGMTNINLSHEVTLAGAKLASDKLINIINTLLKDLGHEYEN